MFLFNPKGADIADMTGIGTIFNTEILTGSFENVPAEHDGSTPFSFDAVFNSDIGISYATLRDHSFTVTNGKVTGARRNNGRNDSWEITVTPWGNDAVTVTLPGNRDCGTTAAICTKEDHPVQLSNSPSATVAGLPGPEAAADDDADDDTDDADDTAPDPPSGLSVADAEATEEEDAALDFVVTLDPAATAAVTVDYATADGTATAGSDYTATSGTLTFQPGETSKTVSVPITDDAVEDGGEILTLTLSGASGADLDDAEATGTIQNTETPLTASFEDVPSEHDGSTVFTFRLRFSEDPAVSYEVLRDRAFSVSGGTVKKARRVDGRNDLREIHVQPETTGEIRIDLPAATDCDAVDAICTEDGRPLSHSLSETIASPVGISVADARVEEGAGAVLAFAVTLSRAAAGQVTVDYQTVNGTAAAGTDYTATSGTLTFEAGESSQTVEVAVLDDSHDEGEETMTLRLSNPSEGRLADAEATGTIENTDPLPRALLARFGRATALHVMEQVEERLEASRAPGLRGRFAGRELRRGMERDMGRNFLSRLQSTAVAGRPGYDGRPVRSERRRATADGSRGRGRADGLGVRVEPRDGRRRERLALEPRDGVAVQRPGRRAVARRRGPHDDVRRRLLEGAADGGADALAPPRPGRLPGGRRGRGGLVGDGAPPLGGLQAD